MMYSQIQTRNQSETGMLGRQIEEFLRIKKCNRRPSTIKTYGSVLERYMAYVGQDHWPPGWQEVLGWLEQLQADRLAESTIYSYWVQLRTFLNFTEKMGVLEPEANPVRVIERLEATPQNPDLPPVAFPPEDTHTLFRYLEQLKRAGKPEPVRREAIRNLALLRFAYVSGVREGAIARLKLGELNFRERYALIPASSSKSKRLRRAYFDRQVKADLQAWLGIRPRRPGVENVFVSLRGQVGAEMTPKGIYVILQRVCKAAGVGRRKFHALRHSSALDALDAGITIDKVQRQLGHASLTTTLRYVRGRDEDRRRAYQEHSLTASLARRAEERLAELEAFASQAE